MEKSSLKDWFKFQVWRQSGGTLPELCDLSEIREWLNETADDPDLDARISDVEKAIINMQTSPTLINLSDYTNYYVIEGGENSIVVVTDNAADAKGIVLPAAIVGLRVTIINQDNASVSISAASGEYINGSDSTPFSLTTLNSATFYCYADGFWAII